MHFTIIGAGNTGQTFAGYLSLKGQEVLLYSRNPEKVRLFQKDGIHLEGALEGDFSVAATSDMETAVRWADCILVSTTATAHGDVCRKIKPYLKNGQRLILFNGNWGALTFKRLLGDDIREKALTVAETGAMLFIASAVSVGNVHVKKIKQSIELSCLNPDKNRAFVRTFESLFPQFTCAGSVFETSFNNSNPPLHVPLTLFNLARIDGGQAFRFYGDGASPSAIAFVEGLDRERMAVGQALGLEASSTLEIINSFWPDKHDRLYDAIHGNASYIAAPGPTTLNHRYVTEDVPFGMVPLSKFGKHLGMPTPHVDLLIDTFSLLMETDYRAAGPELDYAALIETLTRK